MATDAGMTELRRGVLGPCVLALLDQRPRFGLELVRDLAAAGGLLTSDGTVYPLLNRLRDARPGDQRVAGRGGASGPAATTSITDAGPRAAWRRSAPTGRELREHRPGVRVAVPPSAGEPDTGAARRKEPADEPARCLRPPAGPRLPARAGRGACAALPAAQAAELREQITAHLRGGRWHPAPADDGGGAGRCPPRHRRASWPPRPEPGKRRRGEGGWRRGGRGRSGRGGSGPGVPAPGAHHPGPAEPADLADPCRDGDRSRRRDRLHRVRVRRRRAPGHRQQRLVVLAGRQPRGGRRGGSGLRSPRCGSGRASGRDSG